ncbi:rab-like protein 6 isoform X2 [Scleropages formosus]|uniref:rab-like protein 6 isoform X2 n=1 Tax=Scleropages formosus TaxID=113540 RepID=UPI0008783820|nr:rab-like protein 6 isoform X2 [Scleropages formosus]
MFSALRKLVGSEGVLPRDKTIPAGLQSMNQSLQRRFAKGVQYNMKIVIRGDRNTGKSTLWHRLQGKKFQEEYIPTQEIQVTSIHWNYKTTDDVVKVEVWDVVDKGQKYPLPEGLGKGKKRGESLKLENEPQESEAEMALDAEFLDVYKNCNGVIMMFDITKQWTFNYILRELPKVPTHVPVCVLGNQRDMGEHRVILPDDIRDFISGLNRPLGSSYIHYAESSMKNGFGLKYLHRFFNIPFLQLQRETLLRQLETNQLDMDATLEELTVQQETEDQNYDIFLERMEARGQVYGSPGPSNGQSPSSGSQSPVVPPSGPSTATSSPGTPQPPVPAQIPCPPPHPTVATATVPSASQTQPLPQPPEQIAPSSSPQAPPPQKRGFMSRLFGTPSTPEVSPGKQDTAGPADTVPQTKVQSVDDFMPDEGLDRSFLEGGAPAKAKDKGRPAFTVESDSDGDGRAGNPMVAGFQDDLHPDDKAPAGRSSGAVIPSMDVALSSDEEDRPSVPSAARNDGDKQNRLDAGRSSGSLVTKTTDSKPPKPTEKPASTQPPSHVKKIGGATEGESSDTDLEAPVAKQLLSFVMDDPDFESEGSDTQKMNKDFFPVRDDLSDLSDDELPHPLVPSAEHPKSSVLSFKTKDDADLFGLGFEDVQAKARESSEEDKLGKHLSKDKKKKKKSKEEEEKSSKRRHKHKKKTKEEVGTGEEKEKKKKKSRSKKGTDVDDLETFLAGGEGQTKATPGEYEEL